MSLFKTEDISRNLHLDSYLCTVLNLKPFDMTLGILLIFGLGTTELLLIALVVLLLFGGKKIPELMKGLGKGVKSFKDGMEGIDEETKKPSEKGPPEDPAASKN
jgi:sec-independent protein translocase protein TatA